MVNQPMNRQFNALTPQNQMRQVGPNFCPFCDYWHPVPSITTDHVRRDHGDRLREPSRARTLVERQDLRAAAVAQRKEIRARKAARNAKRGKGRE